MDGFEEKKWFVYLGDHHEGPFSLSEIQGKLNEGQVSTSSFVWAEGMADWKVMSEVAAFEAVLNPAMAAPQMPALEAAPMAPAEVAQPVPEIRQEPALEQTASITNPSVVLERVELAARPASHAMSETSQRDPLLSSSAGPEAKPKRSRKLLVFLLLPLLIAGGGAGAVFTGYLNLGASSASLRTGLDPLLMRAVSLVPMLGKWISPIPELPTVAPNEYEELKAAASAKLDKDGPRIAVALGTDDLLTPVFYVASNLPDGAVIDLYVEGIPETLLNQLSFTSRLKVVVTKKLGQSAPLKFAENKALPRGQYELFAIESDQQAPEVSALLANVQPATLAKAPASLPKGFKLVATRSYFLGGKKDTTYSARLKEFHDKLREKATKELLELKQFSSTLETTLNSGLTDFVAISRLKPPAVRRRKWDERHKMWSGFAAQMTDIFQKWTPEVLEKEFFYGPLYLATQQAFRGVEQLHATHHAYFTTTVDQKAFEIQVGQATAAATAGLAALKAKIEQVEKIPPAPNGMPRREGI